MQWLLKAQQLPALFLQVFCRMLDMVVHERRDEEVAVIVAFIVPDLDPLPGPSFFCRGREVLWEKLALLVEIVGGALWCSRSLEGMNDRAGKRQLVPHQSRYRGAPCDFLQAR